jgi:CRP-like cAMP-binding protein
LPSGLATKLAQAIKSSLVYSGPVGCSREGSEEKLAQLVTAMRLKVVKAGETVVHEGRAGSSFFIVEAGELVGSKGGDVCSSKYANFDTFGDLALLQDCPYDQVHSTPRSYFYSPPQSHPAHTPDHRRHDR